MIGFGDWAFACVMLGAVIVLVKWGNRKTEQLARRLGYLEALDDVRNCVDVNPDEETSREILDALREDLIADRRYK